jgi:LuxR family maltose regulon positive regulatory protein
MPGPESALNPPVGGYMAEQAAPLLSVKTRPPWRSRGIIQRPRLDAFLDLIRHRLLTLVIAPPGFGKTTAALSWVDALAGAGGRIAWLSLGPGDDEPERFLDYLEAAVAPVFGKPAHDAGGMLAATFSVPMPSRLGWLLEALGELEQEVFLFLDDFHLISHPDISAAMLFLLRHAPENFHVVLLSRENLTLTLDPLRARDAVFDISASALLFDVNETDQLLQKGEFIQAVSDEAPALHTLSGGWIAALRAAVATLRSHGRPEQYLRQLPATLRPISSLFSDLLEGLSPELVGLLESVCITERQCGALVEVLCPGTNGQAMLEQLERTQLFINRQDDRGSWFVFHPLFREFLEQRIRSRAVVEVHALHRRASHWFAAQTLWSEAIHHALVAGDVDQALGWIESHAMVLVGDGDILTLLSWERQLSEHLVRSPIRLRLAFSWALSLAMASERALALLGGVESELDALASTPARDRLQRECRALRAVLLAEKGDYEAASVLAKQYLQEPVAQSWVPNALLNVIASAHLHTGRWEQLYIVPPLAQDPNRPRMRDRTSMVYRLSILGLAEYRQGHLEESARYLEEGMALGAALGARGHVLQALPAPTLALVRYEQGRMQDAWRINAEHFEVNRRVGPINGLSGGYQIAARMARLRGQGAQARALLDDAERIASARGWHQVQAIVCMERIRYFLTDGRMPEASASMARLQALAGSVEVDSLDHVEIHRAASLARAWRDLVLGASDSAASSLALQLKAARTMGKLLDELSIGTALALAYLRMGRHANSLELFLDLCRKAQTAGALRSLLDQPVSTDGLIRLAIAQAHTAPDAAALIGFLESLRAAQGDVSAVAAAGVGTSAAELSRLSPREHGILKLISQGQSNKEIARNLGLAAETVKSHLKKIYAKLGVQNRAQAAARSTGA